MVMVQILQMVSWKVYVAAAATSSEGCLTTMTTTAVPSSEMRPTAVPSSEMRQRMSVMMQDEPETLAGQWSTSVMTVMHDESATFCGYFEQLLAPKSATFCGYFEQLLAPKSATFCVCGYFASQQLLAPTSATFYCASATME